MMKLFFTALGIAAGILLSRKRTTSLVAQPPAPPVKVYQGYDPNEEIPAHIMEKIIRTSTSRYKEFGDFMYVGDISADWYKILTAKAKEQAADNLINSYRVGELPESWKTIVKEMIEEKVKAS